MIIGCLMICRNESNWIEKSIEMVLPHVNYISITRGKTSWYSNFTKLDDTDQKIKKFEEYRSGKIIYTEVEKPLGEENQRTICLDELRKVRCDIVWIVDCDEFYHEKDIKKLFDFVAKNGPDKCGQIFVNAFAYWRGFAYRSIARERFGPVLFQLRDSTKFNYLRNIDQDPGYTLEIDLHHMSFIRTEEEVYEKIHGWGHSNQVTKDWYEKKWKGWLKDRNITNLHPVSPGLWPKIIKIDKSDLPSILHTHPWFDRDIVR